MRLFKTAITTTFFCAYRGLFPIVTIPRKYALPCIENNRKKLVISTAFLFATVTANQAVACDMGAIETWVAAACQGTLPRLVMGPYSLAALVMAEFTPSR